MATTPVLTAADVMTASPRTCSPFSTVIEAVMIFRDADCGAVPVVDAGEVVGILTDRDIALAVGQFPDLAGLPVAELMSKGVVAVKAETPVDAILQHMETNTVRRVLVVDATKQILGIVAFSDLAPHVNKRDMGEVVTEVVKKD